MRSAPPSRAVRALRKELGKRTARSIFRRRSLQAVATTPCDHGPPWAGSSSSNQSPPSSTPATYGFSTPTIAAPAKWRRSARRAGVAITASPIQLGRKTAIRFMTRPPSRRPQPLQQPRGAVPLAQLGEVNAPAVGLHEVAADHLLLAVVGALDQHVG